eukprot:363429-Chlamydomonas_euryale.AAC.10
MTTSFGVEIIHWLNVTSADIQTLPHLCSLPRGPGILATTHRLNRTIVGMRQLWENDKCLQAHAGKKDRDSRHPATTRKLVTRQCLPLHSKNKAAMSMLCMCVVDRTSVRAAQHGVAPSLGQDHPPKADRPSVRASQHGVAPTLGQDLPP